MNFNYNYFFDWYNRNNFIYDSEGDEIKIKYYYKNKRTNIFEYKEEFIDKVLNFVADSNRNKIYVNIPHPEKQKILFIIPTRKVNSSLDTMWGDHYTFVKENNLIKFHKTIENDVAPSTSIKNRINCYFTDGIYIPQINKTSYSINDIRCENETHTEVSFIHKFTDDDERELIKKILVAPFIVKDLDDDEQIREMIDMAGGDGKKSKIKTLKNKTIIKYLDKSDLHVVISKHKNIWNYSVTLMKDNNDEFNFKFTSKDIHGKTHDQRIANYLKKI